MAMHSYSENTRNSAQQIGQDRPNLLKTIRLLTACLDSETEALQHGRAYDVRATSVRKNRFLFDLTRASRGLDADGLDGPQRSELSALKSTIEKNAGALKSHVSAVREVSEYFQELVDEANSDGTYSRPGY